MVSTSLLSLEYLMVFLLSHFTRHPLFDSFLRPPPGKGLVEELEALYGKVRQQEFLFEFSRMNGNTVTTNW